MSIAGESRQGLTGSLNHGKVALNSAGRDGLCLLCGNWPGYVSHVRHDFGSILKFIEGV
jgi:hypothetical protein